MTRHVMTAALVGGALLAGVWIGRASAQGQAAGRVFELRTYTTAEGKLQTLSNRFRDRTMTLLAKHGMSTVGAWIPNEGPHAADNLVFLMVWPSREVADKTWAAFGADPEWTTLVAETEKDGRLWTKLERVWMSPTEYSPMR